MKQMKVAIVDDEPIAIEVIKELVNFFTTDLEVIGTATNGVDALKMINTLKPDLLFMDVNMPLMNGMEVLEKLGRQDFQLILTTGDETEALKHKSSNAVEYLLKPIDPEEFLAAVKKARKKQNAED